MKRFLIAAFLIIATVQGFLLNLGDNLKLEVEKLKKENKLSFANSLSCIIPIFFLAFSSTQISSHPLSYACSHMFCSQTYLKCGDHMFCSQISLIYGGPGCFFLCHLTTPNNKATTYLLILLLMSSYFNI